MKRFDSHAPVPHNLELCCAKYVRTPGPYTCPLPTARCKLNQPILGRMRLRKTVINHLSSGHFQFAFAIVKAWPSQLGNPSCSCHIADSHSFSALFSAVCSRMLRSRRSSASIFAAVEC
jgi:hypothetical protein